MTPAPATPIAISYTTQIGGEFFTAFRTGPSKSRFNFLSLMRGNYQDYVINDATLDYLERRRVEPALVAKLQTQQPQLFGSQVSFLNHLAHKGIDLFDAGLIRILGEAGMWGTIRHHGLLGNTVIVSDDAGQFRVANHALCWVHSERLLQKLMPGNAAAGRSRWIAMARDLVWCFYKALKACKLEAFHAGMANGIPSTGSTVSSQSAPDMRHLDKLLERLLPHGRTELLKVLDHPEIPLHTNASENDLRSFVTKRKISGGTMSRDGRVARDAMLGLMKTCRKLGLSFYHYLGDRLDIGDRDQTIPPLAMLVAAKA